MKMIGHIIAGIVLLVMLKLALSFVVSVGLILGIIGFVWWLWRNK